MEQIYYKAIVTAIIFQIFLLILLLKQTLKQHSKTPSLRFLPIFKVTHPVFTGTRVPVKNFFDYLKNGDTIEEFLHDFPSVQKAQITGLLSLIENLLLTANDYEDLDYNRLASLLRVEYE